MTQGTWETREQSRDIKKTICLTEPEWEEIRTMLTTAEFSVWARNILLQACRDDARGADKHRRR